MMIPRESGIGFYNNPDRDFAQKRMASPQLSKFLDIYLFTNYKLASIESLEVGHEQV